MLPLAGWYRPAEQLRQALEPGELWNRPGGQAVQTVLPMDAVNDPGGHGVHGSLPVALKDPGGQSAASPGEGGRSMAPTRRTRAIRA